MRKTSPREEQGPGVADAAPAAARNATAQTMRQSNRSLLLNLIREHAPVSRPQLAAISGIHRSNVAVIAGTLIAEGLVREASGEARGRGRVPSLLTLEDSSAAVLGISVRPGETTGLLASLDGRMETIFTFPTPARPEELIAQLLEQMKRGGNARALRTVRQVVLAVPGRVFPSRGLWMPDFPQYEHFPLDSTLAERLGKPVALVNGGNVAAMAALHGERPFSAASPGHVAFVAVHEDGVGGGILFNGSLFAGFDGNFAGEFGHMLVDPEGPPCPCGGKGCWGQLISDHAVWAHTHPGRPFSAADYRASLLSAQTGSETGEASALFAPLRMLLRGLRNIAATLNPREIIVAGEICNSWRLVEEQLGRAPLFPGFAGELRPATLPLLKLFELGTVQYGLRKIIGPLP